MPPKKANKKDTAATGEAVVSPSTTTTADVTKTPVTPSSPAKKSPEKKKAAAGKTNGVGKEEKPKKEKKAAAAPKKKTPKKDDKATSTTGVAEGSPKKSAGGSPKKAAVKSDKEASPKKKAAKKRPKSDAENSQTEASGAEGGPSPVKKPKKAAAAAKPKKEKEGAAAAKSPKKAAAAKPKKTKSKESGAESAPEGATPESPKKKKAAKKKAETPADGSEPTPKKSKKKKAENSGEAGADEVKPKKKAAPKKKKAEGEAAAAAGAVSGAEGESPKKKVSKPRPKKPKPLEDDTPVVGQRKGYTPMPAAMPTLLKKAVTSKSKPKKAEAENENDETAESEDDEQPQPATQKPSSSKGGKKLLNSTETDWENQQFQINHQFRLKIASWNVSGLRAWLDKGGKSYLLHERPDIVCLQETKCKTEDIPDGAAFSGYHPYWLGFGGHAGVGIYSRQMPINVSYGIGDKEMDAEGRLMCAEYEKFFLVNVYVPNAGRKLVTLPKRLRWNKLFKEYIQALDRKKAVIVCGDMNVAHEEIDLANPKTNKKNAGFTQEERDGMTDFLKDCDFVDTFRHFYPTEKAAYTFWTYMMNARAKNVGWRLDYILVSKRILDKVVDNKIRSRVLGSDHCPIVGFFNL